MIYSFFFKASLVFHAFMVFAVFVSKGQQIQIKLIDSITQKPIALVNYSLLVSGKAYSFGITKTDGVVLLNLSDTGMFRFTFRHVNYKVKEHVFFKGVNVENYYSTVLLEQGSMELPNVTVVADFDQSLQKDTTSFDAEDFKSIQTRKVSDLLSNIRGFSIEPDGRIMFKGREVEALLVNDDDVAQNEYGLLTKNLDASIVSKIHVYDNYHRNRLMGKAAKSGKLAVNLELKSNLEGKLSGSAMFGLGSSDKYEGDGNLIWLKGRLKVIELLNFNNTSLSKRGESFSENGVISPEGMKRTSDEQHFKGQFMVSAAIPSLPPLENPYTFFNRDAISKTFLHYKMGASLKASLNIGLMDLNEQNASNALTSVMVDSLTDWKILNTLGSNHKQRVIEANANLSHDNKKKLAGNLLIQLRYSDDVFNLEELAAIAIQDSLNDKVSSVLKGLKLSYTGAWQPGKKQVYFWQAGYAKLPADIFLQNKSSRWGDYWNIGSEISGLEQFTNTLNLEGYAEAGTMIPLKGIHYNTRFRYDWAQTDGNNDVTFLNRDGGVMEGQSGFRTMGSPQTSHLFWKNNLNGNFFEKKLVSELEVSPGIVWFHDNNPTDSKHFPTLVFQSKNRYRLARRYLAGFDAHFNKSFPTHKIFWGDSLIQGHVMVQQRADQFESFTDAGLKMSVQRFFPANNAQIEVSFFVNNKNRDYRISPIYDPNVNQWNWAPMGRNSLYGSTLQGKTYIFPLKITLSGQVQFTISEMERIVNQRNVMENTNQLFSLINIVTNLKKKYNFELQYNIMSYSSVQDVNSGKLRANFLQYKATLKAKWNVSESIYFGSQYQFIKIESNGFHGMEFYSTFAVNKKFSIDFRLHNIFGADTFNYVVANPNLRSTQGFKVVPRFGILKFYYSF